jgi:predicted RNA-binding Zn-ribbon protein involved in translation (DUF1610 family)
MDAPHDHDAREARANVLYWDSDSSVNDIADAMDLSKGSLYGLIRPRPAELACPECGAMLEYPNRTARDKGFVTCPGCGLEDEEELVREIAGAGPDSDRPRAPSAGVGPGGAVLVTSLLGAAAALAVVRWIQRR